MSPHVATFPAALNHLLCAMGWGRDRWFPLFERDARMCTVDTRWREIHGRHDRAGLQRLVRVVDETSSPELELGLPRKERGFGSVRYVTVLWARVEGTEQVRRAAAFRPLPSIVIREGASSRRLLIWPLLQELGWEDVTRANKRIAYRLGAPQKWAEPEAFACPVPGTCLRVGRKRPVPVRVARLEDDMFKASEVVRRLKDPPEPTWMERTG